MSDINFLPSEAKDDAKEEKKIRRIEFTPGERSKNNDKRAEHGGVFSIFNKKKDQDEQIEIAPPPPKPKKEEEPQVRVHTDKKKSKEKVIQVTQPEVEAKKKPGFFARLFSRTPKPLLIKKEKEVDAKTASEREPLPPPPPAPKKEEPHAQDSEHKAFEEMVIQKHEERQQKKVGAEPSTPSPLPPQYHASEDSNASEVKSKDTKPQKEKSNHYSIFSRLRARPHIPQGPPSAPRSEEEKKTPLGQMPEGLHPLKKSAFDVNLVPDELVVRKRTMNRLTLLGLVTVLALFGVGVIYGILAFYQQNVLSNAEQIKNELQRVEQQIDTLEPIQRDALVLQKRTQEISGILDSHIYWSSFFNKLSQYTLQDVTFIRLTADANGAVTLTGEAADPAAAFEQRDVFLRATDLASAAEITNGPSIPQTLTIADTTSGASSGSGALVPVPDASSPLDVTNSTFTIRLTLAQDLIHTPPLLLEE